MELLYILLFLIIFIIYYYYVVDDINQIEGFDCDVVYAKIYDKVFDEKDFYKNNINLILNHLVNKDKRNDIKILDAGCCTGKHYQYLSTKYPTVGTDTSEEMLKYAKIRNPNGNFIKTDLLSDNVFKPEEFRYIMCLHDSLYHYNPTDREKLLSNFYYWLKPDSYLCVHMFDRKKLDAGPRSFSQYYTSEDGLKHALTYFNTFTHDAHWKNIDDNKVSYNELIVLEDGRKKEKTTELHIPKDNRKIVNEMKDYGFKLADLYKIDSENDIEIYIFKKEKFAGNIMKV